MKRKRFSEEQIIAVLKEADVAQALQRQHLADRLGDHREHAARAGVEEAQVASATNPASGRR